MLGQAHHFRNYAPEKIEYAIDRYTNETGRLYNVIDKRLDDRDYLAGNYSIADMANWSWVRSHKWARVPTKGLYHLERWIEAMAARPGCQRGVNVPPATRTADETKRSGTLITTT